LNRFAAGDRNGQPDAEMLAVVERQTAGRRLQRLDSPEHRWGGNLVGIGEEGIMATKTLIIYDSFYGNTQQIALAIANAFENQEDITLLRVGEVRPDHFEGLKLLIVGSPTQRFRSTPAVSNLLNGISKGRLKGVKVAAFDTRLTMSEIKETPALAFFVRLFGHSAYAAKPIADSLQKSGGELIMPPEGFYVEGMEGPLVQGETERAEHWARQIIQNAQ